MFKRMGLIGCGLMGGSLALALRRARLVDAVCAFSPDAAMLDVALERGAITHTASSAQAAVRDADLVMLAVPVAATHDVLQDIAPVLRADAIISDVGSTKQNVLAAAQQALGAQAGQFVAAHPIAGKEHAGIAHADADLYRGRLVILTPESHTRIGALQHIAQMWEALGCTVQSMTPQAHDAAFAAISHLPHLAAFALMHSIEQQGDAAATLALAGSGFRDFSRIAAGDPDMWRDVFLCNREEVLRQCDALVDALHVFARAIETGDAIALRALIAQASAARAAWHMRTQDDNARL